MEFLQAEALQKKALRSSKMELSTVDSALRSLLRRENVPASIVEAANALMEKPPSDVFISMLPRFLATLDPPRWDVLAVGFVIASAHATTLDAHVDTWDLVVEKCHANLEHLEPRVRRLVGKALGSLCAVRGVGIFEAFRDELLDIVECNITRSPEFEEINEEEYFSYFDTSIPLASPLSTPTSPHRLDDISGFKSLETTLLTFKSMVQGLGPAFLTAFEANEFDFFHSIIVRSVKHGNRHVRNVGFETLHVLHKSVLSPRYMLMYPGIGHGIVDCLVRGLQDPWSEVRLTASQATRSFLLFCDACDERPLFYPKLVPRMCLNRHYVADGVKAYSRDTWMKVMGETGRHVVAQFAAECVQCYVDATDADNPFVREAACICIGELVARVDAAAIRPHALDLLRAARICLQDDVFTVSDAACAASSQVVLSFPVECRDSLPALMKWWTVHLSDDVWSVREDAAVALGSLLRAYPTDEVLRKQIADLAKTFLAKAKDQPAMSQAAYDALVKSEVAHSNKQRFSCCSFEPRQLKRTTDHDLCHGHDPAASHALWAYTDGAIYLVREMCAAKESQADAIALFPDLVDASILRHFPQASVLQETLWKQLPAMGAALGKPLFKRHIELFFDPLALTLQGTHRLAKFAAVECTKQLSQLIGPSIFRGRLEANSMWMAEIAPYLDPQP
ncbi:hypothetical protein H310_00065 [Aphanomyces invadans]|uniref:Uncharacterized protein n=1 Tax=Aphanomyces invadans TaxID=157072 RepID=A0A024USK6_9STRA|nr:hypothetical protein H310_00065 [Aphanomyces invadans]ETW09496.1 hypothetical protein H310_00065 [Aphanomyces invadans]|eukprot:XP_008860907.1 hypothetical protein H310_00065 [Aphanomyces invadans]